MDEAEQITGEKVRVPIALKWLETLLITAFFLAFSVWHRPDDPFYLTGNFPWPVLAPLLVGLRYGFFMALISALIIIAALGFHLRLEITGGARDFPYVWTIGVLGISLLAGEFRDYWGRQQQKLEASNDYRGSRLEEFTRNYYLLKVSHDRLEQQLAGSSSSLREALRRLYAQVGDAGQTGLNQETASLMLQLLGRYGQLQIAGIYAINNGVLEPEPLATVGRFRKMDLKDPLLLHALAEWKLVSVQTEFRQRIEAMPFFSFEARSLRLLAILAGHMADIAHEQTEVKAGGSPEWRYFRRHLARAGRDAEFFNLPAAMVGLPLADSRNGQLIADHIQKVRRGLDVIAEHRAGNQRYIVVLMPLTDELGLAGYLQRLDDGLREQLGLHASDLVTPQTLQVRNRAQADEWVQSFLFDSHGETNHGQ